MELELWSNRPHLWLNLHSYLPFRIVGLGSFPTFRSWCGRYSRISSQPLRPDHISLETPSITQTQLRRILLEGTITSGSLDTCFGARLVIWWWRSSGPCSVTLQVLTRGYRLSWHWLYWAGSPDCWASCHWPVSSTAPFASVGSLSLPPLHLSSRWRSWIIFIAAHPTFPAWAWFCCRSAYWIRQNKVSRSVLVARWQQRSRSPALCVPGSRMLWWRPQCASQRDFFRASKSDVW